MAEDPLRDVVAKICQGEAETYDGEILKDMILSEFVIVACRQGWNRDGEPVTQVMVIPGDGPEHRILGLLHAAILRFESEDPE